MRRSRLLPLIIPLSFLPAGCTTAVVEHRVGEEWMFTAPNGKVVHARQTDLMDADAETDLEPVASLLAAHVSSAAKPSDGEHFNGTARAAAKLSFVAGASVHTFHSVTALLAFLAPDASMQTLEIPHDAESDRVEEEQFNVSTTAFLVAAKKETDNDYHLILCDDPASSSPTCMTGEISGLPSKGSTTAFKNARRLWRDLVTQVPTNSKYVLYEPFEVTVAGSAFFDVNHGAGVVGPAGTLFVTDTSWEIHPVRTIH